MKTLTCTETTKPYTPDAQWVIEFLEYIESTGKHAPVATMRRVADSHAAMLEALIVAGNVIAGVITGDLKSIDRDSPTLAKVRAAISLAKGE